MTAHAFVINEHVTGPMEPTGYISAACMLCDYTTRDFSGIEPRGAAQASVVQHIATSHGRRRFLTVSAS